MQMNRLEDNGFVGGGPKTNVATEWHILSVTSIRFKQAKRANLGDESKIPLRVRLNYQRSPTMCVMGVHCGSKDRLVLTNRSDNYLCIYRL